MSEYKIGTKCLHSGYSPKNGEPRCIPIVQSTTYKYDSSVEMGELFDLKASGYFYSRLENPTCNAVAARITDLEGGVAGLLTSSGQAANFFAIFNICCAGDHVIASTAIYGGTFNLFNVTMRKMGIDFTFVSPDVSEEELNALFQDNTKAVFGETLSNPSLQVLDLEKFAKVAHANGVPFIVDNTFATPVNCQAFDFGVDIVTHSTTKYMDGHATSVGGAIVDSGNFDWTQNDKFPGLTTPDASYHGLTYTQSFGAGAYVTKCVVQLMRDLGCTPSPQSSYLLGMGLETLEIRMQKHCENAYKIASFLNESDLVSWVSYPSLETDSQHELAKKYMPKGTCGVVSFGVQGGRDNATKFMDSLNLASIVTHVADSKTCVLHPASTTHRQLDDAQLEACGVKADLIRLSVGLEDADDIIADIKQALEKATK